MLTLIPLTEPAMIVFDPPLLIALGVMVSLILGGIAKLVRELRRKP